MAKAAFFWTAQGSEIRYKFRCTVVFTYAKWERSLPGTRSARITDWDPGMTLASAKDLIPPGGNSGRVSPGPTGIARLRPGLIRDASSTGKKRNFPFDDQIGEQLAHRIRGGPPSAGIATGDTSPLLPLEKGTIAITHRRPGETP